MSSSLPPLPSPPPRLSADSIASALSWSPDPDDNDAHDEEARDEEQAVVTAALVRISIVAGLGGLLFGFDTGVVAGALLVIGSDLGGVPLSTGQESGLVSSALVGALLGSLLSGRVGDKWGRKPAILTAAVLFALGALEQAAAQVFKEVILGRVLVGAGVGLASSILPAYLSEISPAKYRGRMVASLIVLVTGGQVVAYLVDAAFFHVPSGWRYMFGLGAVPAILQLVLSFSIPESPSFQIRAGLVGPARKTLRTLYPHSSEEMIQKRIERIQEDAAREKASNESGLSLLKDKEGLLSKLWRDRGNRRALLLACGLQFFQQATGFNSLMYYSGKILEAAHFSNPATFALFVAVSNFLCTIIALRLIDRLGRRTLLLRTLAGMIAGMALLAFSFFFIQRSGRTSAANNADVADSAGGWAYAALFGMTAFTTAYALGLGNVAWVVQSEVFSHELRAVGSSLSTATCWVSNLTVASTFLPVAKLITPGGVFCIFTVLSVAAWVFTYQCCPETKGLSLEQTKALFDRERWYDEESGPRLQAEYQAVGDGEREEETATTRPRTTDTVV